MGVMTMRGGPEFIKWQLHAFVRILLLRHIPRYGRCLLLFVPIWEEHLRGSSWRPCTHVSVCEGVPHSSTFEHAWSACCVPRPWDHHMAYCNPFDPECFS